MFLVQDRHSPIGAHRFEAHSRSISTGRVHLGPFVHDVEPCHSEAAFGSAGLDGKSVSEVCLPPRAHKAESSQISGPVMLGEAILLPSPPVRSDTAFLALLDADGVGPDVSN